MKLSETGEFGLIGILSKMVEDSRIPHSKHWNNLLEGIGDDAAAWKNTRRITLATTDCLVEDVHFKQGQAGWQDLGWKSLAINLSDIAAMAGIPEYALVTLGLPPDIDTDLVIELYQGILELGKTFDVVIAGGDMTASKKVIISLMVSGSSGKRLLKRSSAIPGDLIAVTGHPGMAAAGFALINGGGAVRDFETPLRQSFLRPNPRIKEGIAICSAGGRSAIDISDGLVADLRHICVSSGIGAHINTGLLPVHPAVREAFPAQALDMALGGGEDYELLFTADARVIEKVRTKITAPITIIGEMTEGPAGVVEIAGANGNPYHLEKTGWDHFGSP